MRSDPGSVYLAKQPLALAMGARAPGLKGNPVGVALGRSASGAPVSRMDGGRGPPGAAPAVPGNRPP